MHQPVLLEEVLKALSPVSGEFMIDGTVDGGGHAEALLEHVQPKGSVMGVDQDPDMLALSEKRFTGRKDVTLVQGNYADLPEILLREKKEKADGLLLDLGFSSAQLELPGKGFSFMKDEPLTMTYNPDDTPVSELLRTLSETEIADIIFNYSGERMSRTIAHAIYGRERRDPIATTGQLADLIRETLPQKYEHGRINPATRTFQALRIHANHELQNLETTLNRLSDIVRPGGRVAIISFHSLEDRIVKQQFQILERAGTLRRLTKKPIIATEEEQRKNPRSRSAKLRAAILQ